MSDTGWTKGPWEVRGGNLGAGVMVLARREHTNANGVTRWFMGEIAMTRHVGSEFERRANACLISAAPDLAEALTNALAAGLPEEVAVAARAALQKARGHG